MEVRAALPADCRAIAEVHVASWQAAYAGILHPAFLADLSVGRREEMWREVLSRRQSQILVACADASVVGFVSFGRARDSDAPLERGELGALYVHPRAWSSGVGRALCDAALEGLRSLGFSSVSLWVLEHNQRAIAFYSRAGFFVDAGAEKRSDLGGVTLQEVRMVHAS
jgi:ribosomal protein S18 acetylase RimI-like enzyme